jgi:hypothetical protein
MGALNRQPVVGPHPSQPTGDIGDPTRRTTGTTLLAASFLFPTGLLGGSQLSPLDCFLLCLRLPSAIQAAEQISDNESDNQRHTKPQDEHPNDYQGFVQTVHDDRFFRSVETPTNPMFRIILSAAGVYWAMYPFSQWGLLYSSARDGGAWVPGDRGNSLGPASLVGELCQRTGTEDRPDGSGREGEEHHRIDIKIRYLVMLRGLF